MDEQTAVTPLDVTTTTRRIPDAFTPVRNTEDARTLANKRWTQYRARAAAGAAAGTDSANSFEAWLKMTREQASKALRGDTRAYLAVGRAMGALDTMRDTLTQATHSALDDFALLVNDIIAHNPQLSERLAQLRAAPPPDSTTLPDDIT